MFKEIRMPAGGQTTNTSTIGRWLVKKGDAVKRGDTLLEIETDKATLPVQSVAAGTVLAALVKRGDKADAGDIIAYVGDAGDAAEVEKLISAASDGESVAASLPRAAGDKCGDSDEEDEYQPIDLSKPRITVSNEETASPNAPRNGGRVKAMPNAKKLSRENEISLDSVAAFTGKDFLKKSDVIEYIEKGQSETEGTRLPLTTMRRIIASKMLESTQSIPAFQASVDVDMTACIALRKAINSGKDVKVSYNDILFKCVEAAIRKYPHINASFAEEEIILHSEVNVGLAVSVDGGLVVPVVKNVGAKTIKEIAKDNSENIEKARNGTITPDDMSGGTITVSNLGMYPITQFNAIINPPESCILAIGAIIPRPVMKNGNWEPVEMMTVTGSFDHRVIDGAYGAQFLTALKEIIENPALAL